MEFRSKSLSFKLELCCPEKRKKKKKPSLLADHADLFVVALELQLVFIHLIHSTGRMVWALSAHTVAHYLYMLIGI